MKIQWILIVILTVILVGCGSIQPTTQGATQPEPTATMEPAKTATPSPVPVKSPTLPPDESKREDVQMTQPESGMQSLIEQAMQDLAERLSVSESQITLVEAREVVWPDASLGCPQPGMLYKQVPEDGAKIVLDVDGVTYEYHTGGTRGLFLCETPTVKTEKPPQIDITKLTPQSSTGKNPTPPLPDSGIPPGEGQ